MIYVLSIPGPIDDVEEIRVLEWHGGVGRAFAQGEMIVELETHKALIEVRAGQPAVLRKILRAEGEWQKLEGPLAYLSDDPAETLPSTPEELKALAVEFALS